MNRHNILRESFVYQFVQTWGQYWAESITRQYTDAFIHTSKVILRHSIVVQWFYSDQCFATTLFRKSTFLLFTQRGFFECLSRLTQGIQNLFVDSIIAHSLGVLHRDLEENGVSCICSFLFSYTVLWTLLTLFFGEGFSRTTLLVLFSSVIFFFTFSYIRVKPSVLLHESKIWQWIKEITQ
jgi:hypothetical protein